MKTIPAIINLNGEIQMTRSLSKLIERVKSKLNNDLIREGLGQEKRFEESVDDPYEVEEYLKKAFGEKANQSIIRHIFCEVPYTFFNFENTNYYLIFNFKKPSSMNGGNGDLYFFYLFHKQGEVLYKINDFVYNLKTLTNYILLNEGKIGYKTAIKNKVEQKKKNLFRKN